MMHQQIEGTAEADKKQVIDLTPLGELKGHDVIVVMNPDNFHAIVAFKDRLAIRMTQEQRVYLKSRL